MIRAARNDRARRASVSLGGWHKENRGRRSGELGMGPSSGKRLTSSVSQLTSS